jgi:hypothetical protein
MSIAAETARSGIRLGHGRRSSHHRVADELVDAAAALEDAVRHQLEDLVQ